MSDHVSLQRKAERYTSEKVTASMEDKFVVSSSSYFRLLFYTIASYSIQDKPSLQESIVFQGPSASTAAANDTNSQRPLEGRTGKECYI